MIDPRPWLTRRLVVELVAVHLCLFLVYAPYVAAGYLGRLDFPLGELTRLLADGFRAGHTYLALEPPPALLAAAHPLDPINRELWIWDVSLYQSKLYLYWGPVPAVLLALVRSVWDGAGMPDAAVVGAFLFLRLGLGALLLVSLYGQHFSDRPRWQLHAVLVAHGLALPMLSLAARPAIYEVAITSAQCFLTLAFYCGWRSFLASSERRPFWWAATGLAMAPALGCRLSFLPAVAFLGVVTTFGGWWWRGRLERWWQVSLHTVMIGLPAVALVLALAAYNHVRFGAYDESGVHHQMTANPFDMGPSYLLPNGWTYLFRAPRVRAQAPYLTLVGGAQRPTPAFVPRPPLWRDGEPAVGLLFAWPFFLLALLPLYVWRRPSPEVPAVLRWLYFGSLGLAAISYFPVLTLNYVSLRYFGDLLLGVVVAAAVGLWAGDRSLEGHRAQRWLRAWALTTLLITVGIGALAPIQLAEHNPQVYSLFRRWFLGL